MNRLVPPPRHVAAGLSVLLCLGALLLPAPDGVPPQLWRGGAAIVLAIGFWATGVLPEFVTALLFFFVAVVFHLAPPEVVFSGFTSSAAWLVFGGLVLGAAIHHTGLGRRAVRLALARYGGGFAGLIVLLFLVGTALSYLIPSAMSRVVLQVPIAAAVAESLGYAPHSRGRAGIVLAIALGTTLPAFAILPANVPNVVLAGAAESLYGHVFEYGRYWIANFPVLGCASMVLVPILLVALFNDPLPRRSTATAAEGPWSRGERVLSGIVIVTLLLWASDTVHGLSPAWVALGAAIACFLPGIGVGPAPELLRGINFSPWLFVAAVVGLGSTAASIGLAGFLGEHLASLVPQGGWSTYYALFGIAAATSLVACHGAAPAIVTPIAEGLATATGWPLESVLLTQVPSWVVFPFAYQMPPVMVALSLARIPVRSVLPLFLANFALGLLLVLPAHYLWGRWVGAFPS